MTVSGGKPLSVVTSPPRSLSNFTSGPAGRSRIRSVPSRMNVASPAAASRAARNRSVVPLLPQNSVASPVAKSRAAGASMRTRRVAASLSILIPSAARLSSMCRVSSANKTFSSKHGPLASDASTSARLVSDLLPGKSTVAANGLRQRLGGPGICGHGLA